MNLLLPPPKARATDPHTSHAAAASMRKAATAQAAAVLNALLSLGSAGAEQIAGHCGLAAYQARKRLPELQNAGLIEPTGETRKTSTGRSERLWRAI